MRGQRWSLPEGMTVGELYLRMGTLAAVGTVLGVSRQRVRQLLAIEAAAGGTPVVPRLVRDAQREDRERALAERRERRYDHTRDYEELYALSMSLGYVPTTTTLFKQHRNLYARLIKNHGSVAAAVRAACEDLELPLQVRYSAAERSKTSRLMWARMTPTAKARAISAASAATSARLRDYWARMTPDQRRAELRRRGMLKECVNSM